MESFEAKAKVPTCDSIKPKVTAAPSKLKLKPVLELNLFMLF